MIIKLLIKEKDLKNIIEIEEGRTRVLIMGFKLGIILLVSRLELIKNKSMNTSKNKYNLMYKVKLRMLIRIRITKSFKLFKSKFIKTITFSKIRLLNLPQMNQCISFTKFMAKP